MKQIQKRMIVQIIIGFLMGRVLLFDRNPVGAAYFAAGLTQGGVNFAVGAAIFLGMLSALPMEALLRYGVAMLSAAVAWDLLHQQKMRMKMGHCALVMFFSLLVVYSVQYYLVPFQGKDLVYAVFDLVLLLVFARVLWEGEHFLLHADKEHGMNNEEMISVIIIGAMAVYGLPHIVLADISVVNLVIYVFLLTIGYLYGAGMGAVAGAAAGILQVLLGAGSDQIGCLCLVGICAGMLCRQGKLWLLSGVWIAWIALAFLLEGAAGTGEWKAWLIGSIFFLAIPDKYLRRLRFPFRGEENWSNESLQKRMKYKLKDFSESFQKLSKVLASQSMEKKGIGTEDIRQLMQEMSRNVCEHCENRDACMGQLVLSRTESLGRLAMAQEEGGLVMEQMPIEFVQECRHPEYFLMEANQGLKMARTIMSFENQLAQNRQVIAGQMEQVGELMQDLADHFGEWKEVPSEMGQVVKKALAQQQVDVRRIAFYEDKDGRRQVHMLARTVKGRLVTAKEAAGVLSDLLGRPFAASQECRSVIPREEDLLIFQEDTPFYAVTGVARRAKEGEEVSGDTFSCLSLPNGELLLALSDGMGSGASAMEESQTVIELLEQMTEAGFSKLSALKLINSLYTPEAEKTTFATADVVVLDLYQGSCQFIKNGAAQTWICRADLVETIEGQALPVGVVRDAEPYFEKTQISSGDYVIMMTDGVTDSLRGRQEEMERKILEHRIINPQELAEYILEQAVEWSGGRAQDDMSVIAAGVWKR